MKNPLPVIIIVAILAVVLIGIGISNKGKTTDEISVAVVPKGTTHIFWKSIHEGAKKAGEQTGVNIIWKGPEKEMSRQSQIEIIEDFIVQKVAGIVLAPVDNKAMVPYVNKVQEAGIPCVIIDSAVDTDNYVSFIATDNYQGGVIAARRMGKILDGKGKVIVIKYAPNSSSTTNRENGFIETIEKEFSGIEIVDTKYGMDTVETALVAAEDLLMKNPEIDGMFACNESTAVGALQALSSQGRAGKVKLIGFDSGTLLVENLKKGNIDSLVVQNPFKMGYEGVKAIVDTINGKDVEKRIDTGVYLVTQENIDTPEIQELLQE